MDDYSIIVEEFRKRRIKPGHLRKLLYLIDKAFISYDVALVILETALDLKKNRLGY